MPMCSLGIQTRKLRAQDSPLPFAETVIRSINKMTVEPFSGHASAIVDRTRQTLDLVMIGDDAASLARRHQLARLKAERARRTKCPDAPPPPLCAVRVRTILHQGDVVPRRNFRQPIQVRWMSTHVHRNN